MKVTMLARFPWRAALEVLGRIHPSDGGRRIAVIGDMLELGDQDT